MKKNKAFLNWSSGKDAAFALYQVGQEGRYSVDRLLTSINTVTGRVSMHGLREELLLRQIRSLGIPLQLVRLSGEVSLKQYDAMMNLEMEKLRKEGFTHSIFGDIFLEDLRTYREERLRPLSIQPVFPLWKKDTGRLIRAFLAAGFKAIVLSVNAAKLDRSFCGRLIDEEFLSDLPESVDPCGENGEFHTFVFDGPLFEEPVAFEKGAVVEKRYSSGATAEWDSRFWFCDLLPEY